MKKIISKFSICLIFALTFLLYDLINPAYAYAHGVKILFYLLNAFLWSSFIVICLLIFIWDWGLKKKIIILASVFLVSFITIYKILLVAEPSYPFAFILSSIQDFLKAFLISVVIIICLLPFTSGLKKRKTILKSIFLVSCITIFGVLLVIE